MASALGLTPTEASIAVMLATGRTLSEIAAATGRKKTTIRWHLRQIMPKPVAGSDAPPNRDMLTQRSESHTGTRTATTVSKKTTARPSAGTGAQSNRETPTQ